MSVTKKRGRPLLFPDSGPLSNADRQRLRRERLKLSGTTREITLPDDVWKWIDYLAEEHKTNRDEVIRACVFFGRIDNVHFITVSSESAKDETET